MNTSHTRGLFGAALLKRAKTHRNQISVAISVLFLGALTACANAPETSLTPFARPAGLGKPGALCGASDIQGTVLPAIKGRITQCGVANPVSVSEIAGVTLSRPATMDCTTAKTLRDWTVDSLIPMTADFRGGVDRILVIGHYSCRTRNNRVGAKISEHGKGRAIDIAGFQMKDGSNVTLLDDWNTRQAGGILTRLHRAACGPFGTVLGPNANAAHRDHYHFDTARYRSGTAYCR